MNLLCIGCMKPPNEIPDIVVMARAEGYQSPDAFVMAEEGTLNTANGHFLCDACYIKAGQPANPAPGPRWVAP